MITNIRLAADPYEGARRAYHSTNLEATGQDWEDWVHEAAKGGNGEFDHYCCYSALCADALTWGAELSAEDIKLISYSQGYFEAMDSVISAMIDALPASGFIPTHYARYCRNLHKFPERYVPEEGEEGGEPL